MFVAISYVKIQHARCKSTLSIKRHGCVGSSSFDFDSEVKFI